MAEKIHFFQEDTDFVPKQKKQIRLWLSQIAEQYHFRIKELNYIFCSDTYLHQLNVEYLDHDTLTDIITFDNSEETNRIIGDIFISVDRIADNATQYQVTFEEELRRVIAHGLLHLCGFKDKTDQDAANMRKGEEQALQHWQAIEQDFTPVTPYGQHI
jgi:rRNA maturation RNase YbeY